MPPLKVLRARPATAVGRSVEDYLASVKARGLSPRTVKHYEAVLHTVWLPFLAEQGVDTPHAIDQRLLDRLSTQLLEEGGARGQLSRHSVNSYLGTISHYLTWARKDGEITVDAKPQRPKLPRRILDVVSREEIRAMEDAALSERDKLIVRLLADSGLRLSELLGLRGEDLHEQGRDRFIKVHGKGALDRLVPLSPPLFTRLQRYSRRGRPQDAASDRVFLTARRSRLTGDYEPLHPRAVQELMTTLAAKAGIEGKPTNPHALRHAFATWCLRGNMNPMQLQRILGHSSLEMISSVYSHLAPTDAAAALMAVLRADE